MRPTHVFTPHYDAARHLHNGMQIEHLHCFGCSHSAIAMPWPSRPSGERPCQFCVRNPQHVQNTADELTWHDGSEPVANPMDCYMTLDMAAQYSLWLADAEHKGEEAVETLLALHERLARDVD